MTSELFEKLILLATEDFDAVVPIQPDGRAQPLCALYKPKFCLPFVEKMLDRNEWSLQKLLHHLKTRYVEFAEFSNLSGSEYFFFNVNTPEEYDRAGEIENLIKRKIVIS